MKKIIFAVLPEKGHINPYIGPAQALLELGHDVHFIAPGDISSQLTAAGLRFETALLASGPGALPMRGQALVALVQDQRAMRDWIATLLLDTPAERIENLRDYFREQRPDVLVIDPLDYAAVIAAEVDGHRWVSMSNSLNPVLDDECRSDLLDTLAALNEHRAKLFGKYGLALDFSGCDALSRHLNIAFCTREFVGEPSRSVELVGPSLPLHARGDETAVNSLCAIGADPRSVRPLIYASFGSQIYYWPEIFRRIIAACVGLGVRLALSVGDLRDELIADGLPEFVELYAYAPQLTLLSEADVFVTHGGANSVMESIRFGTPLLVSPMCNDQFHQAHFVQKSGVGVVQDLQRATVAEIRASLGELLHNRAISARMQTVARSYQVDGARASARLIEALL